MVVGCSRPPSLSLRGLRGACAPLRKPESRGMVVGCSRPPSLSLRGLRGACAPLRKPESRGMGVGCSRPPSLPLRGLRGAGAPLRKRAAMHPGWPPPGELAAPLRVAHRCASVETHSGQFSRWGLLPRAPCQPGASPLSVLTPLCPPAADVAIRGAIRDVVFCGEGTPLPASQSHPRGAARREVAARQVSGTDSSGPLRRGAPNGRTGHGDESLMNSPFRKQ